MPPPKKTRTGRKDVEVAAGINPPTTTLHNSTHIHPHTPHPTPLVWQGGDEASCTQCQPLWSQASPAGPSGSYSGLGRCGWLVPLCNSSLVSDTVQVCPLWPRLPGDCVNSPANLRKYPVGIFLKPAPATGLVFHLESHWEHHKTDSWGSIQQIHYIFLLPCYSVTWENLCFVGQMSMCRAKN